MFNDEFSQTTFAQGLSLIKDTAEEKLNLNSGIFGKAAWRKPVSLIDNLTPFLKLKVIFPKPIFKDEQFFNEERIINEAIEKGVQSFNEEEVIFDIPYNNLISFNYNVIEGKATITFKDTELFLSEMFYLRYRTYNDIYGYFEVVVEFGWSSNENIEKLGSTKSKLFGVIINTEFKNSGFENEITLTIGVNNILPGPLRFLKPFNIFGSYPLVLIFFVKKFIEYNSVPLNDLSALKNFPLEKDLLMIYNRFSLDKKFAFSIIFDYLLLLLTPNQIFKINNLISTKRKNSKKQQKNLDENQILNFENIGISELKEKLINIIIFFLKRKFSNDFFKKNENIITTNAIVKIKKYYDKIRNLESEILNKNENLDKKNFILFNLFLEKLNFNVNFVNDFLPFVQDSTIHAWDVFKIVNNIFKYYCNLINSKDDISGNSKVFFDVLNLIPYLGIEKLSNNSLSNEFIYKTLDSLILGYNINKNDFLNTFYPFQKQNNSSPLKEKNQQNILLNKKEFLEYFTFKVKDIYLEVNTSWETFFKQILSKVKIKYNTNQQAKNPILNKIFSETLIAIERGSSSEISQINETEEFNSENNNLTFEVLSSSAVKNNKRTKIYVSSDSSKIVEVEETFKNKKKSKIIKSLYLNINVSFMVFNEESISSFLKNLKYIYDFSNRKKDLLGSTDNAINENSILLRKSYENALATAAVTGKKDNIDVNFKNLQNFINNFFNLKEDEFKAIEEQNESAERKLINYPLFQIKYLEQKTSDFKYFIVLVLDLHNLSDFANALDTQNNIVQGYSFRNFLDISPNSFHFASNTKTFSEADSFKNFIGPYDSLNESFNDGYDIIAAVNYPEILELTPEFDAQSAFFSIKLNLSSKMGFKNGELKVGEIEDFYKERSSLTSLQNKFMTAKSEILEKKISKSQKEKELKKLEQQYEKELRTLIEEEKRKFFEDDFNRRAIFGNFPLSYPLNFKKLSKYDSNNYYIDVSHAEFYHDNLRKRMILTTFGAKVTLKILGDNNYDIHCIGSKKIFLKVYDKDGRLNFLTGIYNITNIIHDLSAGNYTTTLELIQSPLNSSEIRQLLNFFSKGVLEKKCDFKREIKQIISSANKKDTQNTIVSGEAGPPFYLGFKIYILYNLINNEFINELKNLLFNDSFLMKIKSETENFVKLNKPYGASLSAWKKFITNELINFFEEKIFSFDYMNSYLENKHKITSTRKEILKNNYNHYVSKYCIDKKITYLEYLIKYLNFLEEISESFLIPFLIFETSSSNLEPFKKILLMCDFENYKKLTLIIEDFVEKKLFEILQEKILNIAIESLKNGFRENFSYAKKEIENTFNLFSSYFSVLIFNKVIKVILESTKKKTNNNLFSTILILDENDKLEFLTFEKYKKLISFETKFLELIAKNAIFKSENKNFQKLFESIKINKNLQENIVKNSISKINNIFPKNRTNYENLFLSSFIQYLKNKNYRDFAQKEKYGNNNETKIKDLISFLKVLVSDLDINKK